MLVHRTHRRRHEVAHVEVNMNSDHAKTQNSHERPEGVLTARATLLNVTNGRVFCYTAQILGIDPLKKLFDAQERSDKR